MTYDLIAKPIALLMNFRGCIILCYLFFTGTALLGDLCDKVVPTFVHYEMVSQDGFCFWE